MLALILTRPINPSHNNANSATNNVHKTGNNLTFQFIKQLFLLLLLWIESVSLLVHIQRPWLRVWWYVMSAWY